MSNFLAFIQTVISSSDWFFIIAIQVFLLVLFIIMISLLCRRVKEKEDQKSVKKTCILIWFMSAIAWFVMAQIVWILTYSQFSGN